MSALFLCFEIESVNVEIQFLDKIIEKLDFDIERFDNFIDADDVELERFDVFIKWADSGMDGFAAWNRRQQVWPQKISCHFPLDSPALPK